MILAGDVGGTKTALGLFEPGEGGLRRVRHATLPSREFTGLEALVARFLGTGPPPPIAVACFGVPGPIVGGRATTTNLPWELEEGRLAHAIGVPRVKLLNDLEAAGYGVLTLPPEALLTLQAGALRPGHRALIAAGTGLGEAILVWDGRGYTVMASEGGHADFGPKSELEIELLRFLRREFDHVSYERVLSGPGLFNIYRFLRDTGHGREPGWLKDRLAAGDPSAVVSEVALAGGDPLCVQALEVFVSIYGAEAGNLALKALAVGGIVLGGGIAPKIRAKLTDGRFLEAFHAKGRLDELLATIPVHVALNPETPLLGAAHVGRTLLEAA